MSIEKTLTIIKPVAFKENHTGEILAIINKSGFRISAIRLIQMSLRQAKAFYAEHEGRPFYDALTEFMSSAPVIVAILEKDNAVIDYRNLIGCTDPAKASEGTIRKLFGTNLQANAVHGSDSVESAERECNFFFPFCERY